MPSVEQDMSVRRAVIPAALHRDFAKHVRDLVEQSKTAKTLLSTWGKRLVCSDKDIMQVRCIRLAVRQAGWLAGWPGWLARLARLAGLAGLLAGLAGSAQP